MSSAWRRLDRWATGNAARFARAYMLAAAVLTVAAVTGQPWLAGPAAMFACSAVALAHRSGTR